MGGDDASALRSRRRGYLSRGSVGRSSVNSSTKSPLLPMGRRADLEVGSDAHYDDPQYYAHTYRKREEDIEYYLELALRHARKRRCRVLEYGCGNGRIALPLARVGLEVTGVDRSVPMLADFRSRLKQEDGDLRSRVTVKRGDMRRVKLKRRFDLVLCTFNTWLHLYVRQDVERYCARVREHLAPGGRFVVDVSVPDPHELICDPNRAYHTPRFRHPSSGEVVRYAERFDYEPMRQLLMVWMEFEPRDRPEGRWTTPLAHRQYYPLELEALLHYNGLEVVEVHGDFEHEAPQGDSDSLIYHCRLRRGFG
jgi:SAM-dependent methyltransferase